jgi:acetylornithine/N-succinyldiaminopimelate aminotransferase
MAVAAVALEMLTDEALLEHVRRVSGYFTQQLEGLKARFPDVIVDIRGRGLLLGVKLVPNNRAFMQWARDERILVAGGGDNCIRLLPPLTISEDEAREAIAKLEAACEAARAHLQKAKAPVAPPQPVA